MPVQKLNIQQFLELSTQHPVFDVRSPGEYSHAHIPDAYSLPLFTDEERKIVGTAYKQESREKAIKIGLDFFGVKMRKMVEEVESILAAHTKTNNQPDVSKPPSGGREVLVHCWRGGMRSAGVAWLLDLYGYKVYTLAGGYKAYRKWAGEQFEKPYPINILSGYTGSGKTLVLHQLKKAGQNIIDLESLAHHKGSTFGDLGEQPQPTQEMFENLLATGLFTITEKDTSSADIWIEDESQRIGNINLPNAFWKQMRNCNIYFTDIPFEERLKYITDEYGKFQNEKLINAIIRIQKRLGGLETKTAVNFLLEDNKKECFRILLYYYDKLYKKGLNKRENLSDKLCTIPSSTMDVIKITELLIEAKNIKINI
jgi:tRNA 2-selenouridine synthase